MTVNSNKITEITDDELYALYLRRGMDELMDFNEYKSRVRQAGVLVIEGGGRNNDKNRIGTYQSAASIAKRS